MEIFKKHPFFAVFLAAVFLAAIACYSLAAASENTQSDKEKIRICFVTGSNPDRVVMQWYPMITYLTDAVGKPFDIIVRDSYEDMLADYRRGEIDLVMGGPFNYVTTKKKAGATLVVAAERGDAEKLKGIIAVRKNSPLKSIEDLRGRSFAFTEPYSTTGYLLPRLLLADRGISQPVDFFSEVVFAGHHTEAIDAVASGHVDAAAFASYMLPEAENAHGTKLRAIETTPELPLEPLFASPSFKEETADRIRNALLGMDRRVSSEVMEQLGLKRFVEAKDSDYDETLKDEARLEELPPLPYTIDYGHMPTAISRAERDAWSQGLKLIMVVPAAAALFLLLATVAARGRIRHDLKLKFAASLFAAMILVSFAVSAMSAANLRERLGNATLAWQRSINVFTALASSAAGRGDENIMGSLADSLAAQHGISYVKIIRNGFYVADSEKRETGLSIMPKVISGTFRPSSLHKDPLIDATTYIMAGSRRFGAAQIGVDTSSLHKAVAKASAGNALAVALLLALGAAIAAVWSRQVSVPVERLSLAVSDIRAGRRPHLDVEKGDDQIAKLARLFKAMETEAVQTGELLKLKERELEAATRKLENYAEAESRIEEALEEIEDEEPVSAALGAIKVEVESMAHSASAPEADFEALKEKIAEIEAELPALAAMRSTEIIGEAPSFLRVIRDIVIRARDSDPVLLHGESGSGKTGVARGIHGLSSRANRPMVEYNCAEFAAADPAIVLGKLFGYGKDCGLPGVPREGQRGLLEECDGATLFLDEIALLPPQAQGALLLPIEGRPFNPAAGKGAPRSADVRFVFASNARLEDEVAAGHFRNDLLRRIRSRGCIDIPPLCERMGDVPTLAAHFMKLWVLEKNRPMSISPEAEELLKLYDWRHFNVAELATAVKVAADNALFRGSSVVAPEHLPPEVLKCARRVSPDGLAGLFDSDETLEIAALRRNGFRIAPSEKEIGYAPDAKTLSNHLRGLTYKVLSSTGWRADESSAILAGECVAARERVRRKIDFYMKNAAQLAASGGERRIFNNLPQKYHRFAEEAMARHRKA